MVRGSEPGEYIDSMFRQLLQGLPSRVPSQCAVCHAWPAQPVCDACVERFAQPRHRCHTCAMPVAPDIRQCGACMLDPPPLDACVAALAYAYPWSRLVTEFKFRDQPGWAQAFAQLMRSVPWVEPLVDAADLLIPMPLAEQRLRQRGFNQALEICHQLGAAKTDAGLLLRLRDTRPQTALSRAERQANLRHAFAVDPLRVDAAGSRHLVLVDDVMTSGASLHAAARALRMAGATRVSALVLARAELSPASGVQAPTIAG